MAKETPVATVGDPRTGWSQAGLLRRVAKGKEQLSLKSIPVVVIYRLQPMHAVSQNKNVRVQGPNWKFRLGLPSLGTTKHSTQRK